MTESQGVMVVFGFAGLGAFFGLWWACDLVSELVFRCRVRRIERALGWRK